MSTEIPFRAATNLHINWHLLCLKIYRHGVKLPTLPIEESAQLEEVDLKSFLTDLLDSYSGSQLNQVFF